MYLFLQRVIFLLGDFEGILQIMELQSQLLHQLGLSLQVLILGGGGGGGGGGEGGGEGRGGEGRGGEGRGGRMEGGRRGEREGKGKDRWREG